MESKNGSKEYGRDNQSSTNRPTFYMSNELLKAIEAQAQQEHTSRSKLVSNILFLLLLTPIGRQLRENARCNRRSLAQELEQSLALLQEQLPLEQINQFAADSQRSPTQMLTYLVLVGLQTYREKNR